MSKKSKKCKSNVHAECPNTPVTPSPVVGAIVKVPVVLAETTVQINLEAKVKFPEPVLEIKDIMKKVVVTQCRLLLPTNKLFIKGFVRKNIQYATPDFDLKCGISSNIRSLTTFIPFECVTALTFINPPSPLQANSRTEYGFLNSSCHAKGQDIHSNDLSQFNQQSTEFFNELPFCELISASIVEVDEAIDRCPLEHEWIGEGTFEEIKEKMVLDLTVKVLQKQQVQV